MGKHRPDSCHLHTDCGIILAARFPLTIQFPLPPQRLTWHCNPKIYPSKPHQTRTVLYLNPCKAIHLAAVSHFQQLCGVPCSKLPDFPRRESQTSNLVRYVFLCLKTTDDKTCRLHLARAFSAIKLTVVKETCPRGPQDRLYKGHKNILFLNAEHSGYISSTFSTSQVTQSHLMADILEHKFYQAIGRC